MIRLPATGIDISQNDLNFHLQQLDIYQGLLRQGFKKKEIIRYFKDNQSQTAGQETQYGGSLTPAPSTFDLCTTSSIPVETELRDSTSRNSSLISNTCTELQKQSPYEPSADLARPNPTVVFVGQGGKPHAPRQSSLLRYSHGVSPELRPEEHMTIKVPFSPRSIITYRPRSQTYSYDQSELDENDVASKRAPIEELEHLSLNEELLPTVINSTTTIPVVSELRPEAEAFTPLYLRLKREVDVLVNEQSADTSSSPKEHRSLPSSPPLPPQQARDHHEPTSPALPPIPGFSLTLQPKTPETDQRRIHQQYLDGSFTVYDDSVPARLQPQTPADLSRNERFNERNIAYTASPGMIRIPITGSRQSHNLRHPSGDLSPTARALLIRERRQREFTRSARIEGLRIGRTRDRGVTRESEAPASTINDINLWREDLDADRVGEENFEDEIAMPLFRGIRAISGNRRGA